MTSVLYIFGWPFKTGFTVVNIGNSYNQDERAYLLLTHTHTQKHTHTHTNTEIYVDSDEILDM